MTELPATVPGHLASHTRRLERADVADLLRRQRRQRVFWRDAHHTAVGLGSALTLSTTGPDRFVRMQKLVDQAWSRATVTREAGVPESVGPRFHGGFAFHADHVADGRWTDFPGAYMVLPERQVIWQDGAVYEVRNSVEPPEGHLAPPPARPPAPQLAGDDHTAWTDAVAEALRHIEDGDLVKVVLARSERVDLEPDIADVVPRLANGDSFAFAFEPTPGHAFFGATPELLVRLDGQRLQTHALAGSTRRGRDAAEEERLGKQLLQSPKEALEHELVAGYIREALHGLGVPLKAQPRRLRKLSYVQHLETPLEGTLEPEGPRLLDLVAALHPTPAVGGAPKDSLDLQRQLERFPRGWYAGAVGWMDARGNGTFAVALRCALAAHGATWMFAGAGIVAGSDPEREWAETELKLRPMRDVLGV